MTATMDAIKKAMDKYLQQNPSPTRRQPKQVEKKPLTSSDWREFENMLKKHDWSFEMSDDPRDFRKGNAERNQILSFMNHRITNQSEKDKAFALYTKYAKTKGI